MECNITDLRTPKRLKCGVGNEPPMPTCVEKLMYKYDRAGVYVRFARTDPVTRHRLQCSQTYPCDMPESYSMPEKSLLF
jgi:hypothetical protein